MRITLVISSLHMGGAERNATVLVNQLIQRGHRLKVVTMEAQGDVSAFALNPKVEVCRLNLLRPSADVLDAVQHNLQRIAKLRRFIIDRQPDVVVAFMEQTNVLSVLSCLGTGIPVICCERTNPGAYAIGKAWSTLRRLVYPLAQALVFQTERAAAALPWATRWSTVIPNPVLAPIPVTGAAALPKPFVASLGRLAPEKQQDLFLLAFAQIAEHHPAWRAVIIGDGPKRSALERLAGELNLAHRIMFLGTVTDVAGALCQADLFVLTSRFEGFPTALCEALACGIPAVAFDCPSGPAEILCTGVNGLLVPPNDVNALAAALSRLMANAGLRSAMAVRAPEILERFGVDKVMDAWEKLLRNVASQNRRNRR